MTAALAEALRHDSGQYAVLLLVAYLILSVGRALVRDVRRDFTDTE